ncbi:MAG: Asp-tRNA(Asn)/Glu-tRNA(Gln) amidotransferase subunit GatC [Syntrophomonadaceae bacterium]|nr:Asp-tRNA(Asn)/Glu-tRNA(Gln) amidotransferase subunit GatC [Syntrophomonadaceae bacterium]
MALTIKEVEHVAQLARLKLTEEEKVKFAQQLSTVLDYADTLNAISTEGVEPLIHILPIRNVFREDQRKPSMEREEILANAPLAEGFQYKVPKIM